MIFQYMNRIEKSTKLSSNAQRNQNSQSSLSKKDYICEYKHEQTVMMLQQNKMSFSKLPTDSKKTHYEK